MDPETEIQMYKNIVEASFYNKMLEIYLMESEYEELKAVDRIRIGNLVKKSMKLGNRIEC
mgnify:CR=1 FL=1|tara:strand:+ start:159 stop:338 length:180 start_codon:yes stop_codon:yes gene_type:complete